jgi:hypothetical protein
LQDESISDVTGRQVLSRQVKADGKVAMIDFTLMKGAYLISISSGPNKKIIKKLLIAD